MPASFTPWTLCRGDSPQTRRATTTNGTKHSTSVLVFDVTLEADGGYVAVAVGRSIVTQADTWDELRHNVQEAMEAYYYDDGPKPEHLRLCLV